MKTDLPCILTINGGSSSIKFALFETGTALRRIVHGAIERIGLPETELQVQGLDQADNYTRPVSAPDHQTAVEVLMDWIEARGDRKALAAVGHRVVHGGPNYSAPQHITDQMIEELHRLSPFDPSHLPEEILLTEAFHRHFPDLPQVACFDIAFHHDLPRVTQLLTIMRDLLECGAHDVRAAEAVELFCYQAKKWIGAFAAASIFGGNKFPFFLIMRSLVR